MKSPGGSDSGVSWMRKATVADCVVVVSSTFHWRVKPVSLGQFRYESPWEAQVRLTGEGPIGRERGRLGRYWRRQAHQRKKKCRLGIFFVGFTRDHRL
jgi:hypothetical protein